MERLNRQYLVFGFHHSSK